MANDVKHGKDTRGLTTAEIAALALSLAHLGSGPQAATARRALGHLTLDGLTLDARDGHDTPGGRDILGSRGGRDAVVAQTLATLIRPLRPATSDRARVVAEAITERRVVRLCYGDANANVTIREVEPVTCLVHRDHWHFVGWCRMRRGIRAFRFDRILAVEPTGTPAPARLAEGFLPWQRREASSRP